MNSGISSSESDIGITMRNIDLFRVWQQHTITECTIIKMDNRVRLDGTGYLMRLLSY